MLQQTSVIAFVPVSSSSVAEQFYVGKLGLAVVERGPFALVVATASGQTIRCVPVPNAKPQPFSVLGWEVPEIHRAARQLAAAGIEPLRYPHFQQEDDGVWTAPGGSARVVWFNDLDGNILSLSEHSYAVPPEDAAQP